MLTHPLTSFTFFLLCIAVRVAFPPPPHPLLPYGGGTSSSSTSSLGQSSALPPPSLPLQHGSPGSDSGLLPEVDIVIAVTSPWMWVARRLDQYRGFLKAVAASKYRAKLLFVMGEDGRPDPLNEWEDDILAHPDVMYVAAPGCPDTDTYWPGATDGVMFPPVNSSTTCKVLEGAAVAVANFRFKYYARIGDDAYLHWDYFLGTVARAMPDTFLMGRFHSTQAVFSHLTDKYGGGKFLPYALGMGYVMSQDVARYLAVGYKTMPRLATVGPEDAAIALHTFPLAISSLHDEGFHDPTDHECNEKTILVHYVTSKMWSSIDSKGRMYCQKREKGMPDPNSDGKAKKPWDPPEPKPKVAAAARPPAAAVAVAAA